MVRFVIPALALTALALAAPPPAAAGPSGEELFKARCLTCHRGGGNIIKKEKSLSRKDMEANNLRTEEDIVRLIRNPGPGMPKLDEKALPDAEARAVARYVLETFNK